MKIAVIGSGISGLVCAYLLGKKHDVSLFEKNNYLGGHTKTVSFEHENQLHHIDTGFIVFNKKTYPNFCKLLALENVKHEKTEMSFSFFDMVDQFEYNGHSISSLFSQKKNLLNPNFYKMIYDIIKFNKLAKNLVRKNNFNDDVLKNFVESSSFSTLFKEAYLYPMAQAIWSAPFEDISDFSTQFILNFFYNHGLLNIINRPDWYVLSGGSEQYIPKFIKYCEEKIYLNCKVEKVHRTEKGVQVLASNSSGRFDKVIFATHSDEALALLASPSEKEQEILSAIPFRKNDICLHTDISILPQNRATWASWNFRKNSDNTCQLTYYMNRLQNLDSPVDFCVSVNQNKLIDPKKIIKKFHFFHPVLSFSSIQAQKKLPTINGQNNTYFCGAYWQNGFHEDGVVSALNVCRNFGVNL